MTEKLEGLERILRNAGPLAIAYSGGLDSRFLCHTALRLGLRPLSLHVSGPHIPVRETGEAVSWADRRGLNLKLVEINPLESGSIAANGPDRCYHCKHAVFTRLRDEAGDATLCDGTNLSDRTVYRPGHKALKELGIRSPLAEAGLAKEDIRNLARLTGMDRADQAARPCLFTRFNYGVSPTQERLRALDGAEQALEQALAQSSSAGQGGGGAAGPSFPPQFRLRFPHADSAVLHLAVSELDTGLRHTLKAILHDHGFPETSIELVEEISGHFDRQRGLSSSSPVA